MVIFNSYVKLPEGSLLGNFAGNWWKLFPTKATKCYQVFGGPECPWLTMGMKHVDRREPWTTGTNQGGGPKRRPFIKCWLVTIGFPIISIMESDNLQYRRVTNPTSDSSDRRFSTLLHWVEHTSIPLEKHTSPSLAPKRLETPLAHHKKSPPQTGVFSLSSGQLSMDASNFLRMVRSIVLLLDLSLVPEILTNLRQPEQFPKSMWVSIPIFDDIMNHIEAGTSSRSNRIQPGGGFGKVPILAGCLLGPMVQ